MINLTEGRTGFEAIGNTYAIHTGVRRKEVTISGVNCSWFFTDNAPENEIVFYIHGGAFIFGSVNSHAPLVSHIVNVINKRVLVIDYRLAPEHPFPAGINDCVAVIETVCGRNPNVNFGLIGDSAGGNLVLATQLKLKIAGRFSSKFTVVISPWADLECKNESYYRNREKDVILGQQYLMEAAKMYAGQQQLSQPLLSPVKGDFTDLSPVLILCGTYEVLEDDSVNLYRQLVSHGVQSSLELFEGALHVWPFTEIDSDASKKALRLIRLFVTKHLDGKSGL